MENIRTMQQEGLQLIKAGHFGEIQADIYSNGTDIFMTAAQLGECLGYADPIRNISKLVSRANYLIKREFSAVVKLTSTDGKAYNTRVFNEEGIYEITFLSKTDRAQDFRRWVRGVLKSLRSGEMLLKNGAAVVSPMIIESVLEKIGLTAKNIQSWSERIGALESLMKQSIKLSEKQSSHNINNQILLDGHIRQIRDHLMLPFNPLEWKLESRRKAHEIAKAFPEKYKDGNEVFSKIYRELKNVWGWVMEQDIKEHRERHGAAFRPYSVDLISENPEMRAHFDHILSKEYGSIPHADEKQQPCPAKEAASIEQLAELRGDKSPNGAITYRAVYERMMPKRNWSYKIGAYKRRKGIKNAPPKKILIENDKGLQILFHKALEELLEEAGSKSRQGEGG